MYKKFLLVLILVFALWTQSGAGNPIPTSTSEVGYAIIGLVTNVPGSSGNTLEAPTVPVTLLDSNGNVIASTTVSYQDNKYRFDNLLPGNYRIVYGDITKTKRIEKDVTVIDRDVIVPDVMFVTIGESIMFGGYKWIVLDIKDGKALIITESAIACRPYNETIVSVTWATCTLRTYLNGEFYNKFSDADKARIIETNIIHKDNQLYGATGGLTTNDKIFLLSLEEVVLYFGDSGLWANRPTPTTELIDDSFNAERVDYTVKEFSYGSKRWNANVAGWWWLRSPGRGGVYPAYVSSSARIWRVEMVACLRPALWLNL